MSQDRGFKRSYSLEIIEIIVFFVFFQSQSKFGQKRKVAVIEHKCTTSSAPFTPCGPD